MDVLARGRITDSRLRAWLGNTGPVPRGGMFPSASGSGTRFISASRGGQEDGTWEQLLSEAQKQADRLGAIDWVVSIDSTIARVHQHGATLPRVKKGSVELQESARRA